MSGDQGNWRLHFLLGMHVVPTVPTQWALFQEHSLERREKCVFRSSGWLCMTKCCQGPFITFKILLCASLDGRLVWGRMDPCRCVAESLHCSPETITVLLIGYTPMQKCFLVFKKKILMSGWGDPVVPKTSLLCKFLCHLPIWGVLSLPSMYEDQL